MSIDFFAIASNGAFPNPVSPPIPAERMSFLGSWGYFGNAIDARSHVNLWININRIASNLMWPWRKMFKV